jgi:hypothetical protein
MEFNSGHINNNNYNKPNLLRREPSVYLLNQSLKKLILEVRNGEFKRIKKNVVKRRRPTYGKIMQIKSNTHWRIKMIASFQKYEI